MTIVTADGAPYMSPEEAREAVESSVQLVEDVKIGSFDGMIQLEVTFAPFSFRQVWRLLFGGLLQFRLTAADAANGVFPRGVGLRVITRKAWEEYRDG